MPTRRKILLLMILFFASIPLLRAEETKFERTPFHFNVGYAVNKYSAFHDDENEDTDTYLSIPAAHGGTISFDWQGKGILGFQIPVSYFYHAAESSVHEFNVGVNL